MTMPILVDRWPASLKRYGFPGGERRRIAPTNLACVHITGNERTAKNPDLRQAAQDEANYAKRNTGGPSAHYYVARDGWAIESINPTNYAAWSNGDFYTGTRWNNADLDNKGVKRAFNLIAQGFNANESYVVEFELVGHTGAGFPITDEQKQLVAEVIAREAKRTGLPINRNTVHAHGDINGIDRTGCPVPAQKREAVLGDIIDRARTLTAPPPVVEEPPVEAASFSQAQVDAAVTSATAWLLVELNAERFKTGDLAAKIAAAKAALA